MLRDTKKREGVWDSDLAACVGREVAALEEASWHSVIDGGSPSSCGIVEENSAPIMPREHRLNDVRVTLPEEPSGHIVLTCTWDAVPGREKIRRAFDPRQQTWSHLACVD